MPRLTWEQVIDRLLEMRNAKELWFEDERFDPPLTSTVDMALKLAIEWQKGYVTPHKVYATSERSVVFEWYTKWEYVEIEVTHDDVNHRSYEAEPN